MKTTYYFTFGQGHIHYFGALKVDKDSVVAIDADHPDTARALMSSLFGGQWGMEYTEESLTREYFPRGVVLRLIAEAEGS